jgi:hypothetical protein
MDLLQMPANSGAGSVASPDSSEEQLAPEASTDEEPFFQFQEVEPPEEFTSGITVPNAETNNGLLGPLWSVVGMLAGLAGLGWLGWFVATRRRHDTAHPN